MFYLLSPEFLNQVRHSDLISQEYHSNPVFPAYIWRLDIGTDMLLQPLSLAFPLTDSVTTAALR